MNGFRDFLDEDSEEFTEINESFGMTVQFPSSEKELAKTLAKKHGVTIKLGSDDTAKVSGDIPKVIAFAGSKDFIENVVPLLKGGKSGGALPGEEEIDEIMSKFGIEYTIEKSSGSELHFTYLFDDEDTSKDDAKKETENTAKSLMKSLKISKYKLAVKFQKAPKGYAFSTLCKIKV